MAEKTDIVVSVPWRKEDIPKDISFLSIAGKIDKILLNRLNMHLD